MNNNGVNDKANIKVTGHDNRAAIQILDGSVYRTINAEFISETQDVFSKYESNARVKKLVVKTELHSKNQNELVLQHELLKISYPCEWTPAMLVDAALHTLELSDVLHEDRLVLKDFLPSNLLYDGMEWRFIDFCSIIREESLLSEDWIPHNETIERSKRSILLVMFIPFILIPILVGINGSTHRMAKLLKNNYCNSGLWSPGWRNLFFSRISKNYFRNLNILRKTKKLIRKTDIDEINNEIRKLLTELRRKVPKSAYSEYYEEKNANSAIQDKTGWNEKQRSIDSILDDKRPKLLFDIGANTGWYSNLGLKYGSLVYALDNDCASLDIAYRNTYQNGLIPFHLDFDDIWERANPISTSFIERHCANMVLALGLVHHLVLGKGEPIEVVMQKLSELTKEYLVVEFVDLSDEKIQNEPSFFKLLKMMSTDYSEEAFITQGLRYFNSVKKLPSSPGTRTILFFSR